MNIRQWRTYGICLMAVMALESAVLIAQSPSQAADSQTTLEEPWSDEEWERLRKELDFGQPEKEKKENKETPEDTSDFNPIPDSTSSSFLMGDAGKVIAYVLIGLLVIGLIILLLRTQINTKIPAHSSAQEMDIEDEDLDVVETDFERLLRLAIENKNWRLVIRLHFLDTIKKLHEKQHLKWQRHKTNQDYVIELGEAAWKKEFKQLVLLFEIVWYGERSTSEADYQQVKKLFDQFQLLVNAK